MDKKYMNILKQEINIHCKSYRPISSTKNIIIEEARKCLIPNYTFFNLKKKIKKSITILSGPHVNKKAREQYSTIVYHKVFCFNNMLSNSFESFLLLKKQVIQKSTEKGVSLSFSYTNHEKMDW